MLWNWNTIDSCFLARSWRITSAGMFAGSCIGVVLLVMSLEMLRRAVKEWDHYLVRTHRAKYAVVEGDRGEKGSDSGGSCPTVPAFRPNLWQQTIRALLHMVQFAVAYFVMLCVPPFPVPFPRFVFVSAFLFYFIMEMLCAGPLWVTYRRLRLPGWKGGEKKKKS